MIQDRHPNVGVLLKALGSRFQSLGFLLRKNSEFVHRTREGTNVLLMHFRPALTIKPHGLIVSPVVQVNFREEQKIANLLGRSGDLLPSVGGLLHLFTDKSRPIEWIVGSATDMEATEAEVWAAVEEWVIPFWSKYSSMEATIKVIEGEGYPIGLTPHWFDLAAMYYVTRGLDASISFLRSTDRGPSEETRRKAINVLTELATRESKV
jgi:hypothetical protein